MAVVSFNKSRSFRTEELRASLDPGTRFPNLWVPPRSTDPFPYALGQSPAEQFEWLNSTQLETSHRGPFRSGVTYGFLSRRKKRRSTGSCSEELGARKNQPRFVPNAELVGETGAEKETASGEARAPGQKTPRATAMGKGLAKFRLRGVFRALNLQSGISCKEAIVKDNAPGAKQN